MSRARWIFLSICTVVFVAVGLALLIPGLDLASRTDVTCGEHVMRQGDRCPNWFSRGGPDPVFYDYDRQHARNQSHGVELVGFGAVFLLASALFVFGLIYAHRYTQRRAGRVVGSGGGPAPQHGDLMASTKFRLTTVVLATLIGSIYPVGMFLASGENRGLLWMVPLMPFGAVGLMKYGARKRGHSTQSPPEPRAATGPPAGTPANPTRIPAQAVFMGLMLVALTLYGLALLISLLVLPTDAAICHFHLVHIGETCRGHDFRAQKLANLRTGVILVVFCSLMLGCGWAMFAHLRRSTARGVTATPSAAPNNRGR